MSGTPHVPARLTRRTTLGASALGLTTMTATLAGCRWGPPAQVAAEDEEREADTTLALLMGSRIARVHAFVEDVRLRNPSLRAPLAPLLAAHEAHGDALVVEAAERNFAGADPTAGTSHEATGKPATDLKHLRTLELSLQKELTEAAGTATSGPLARTFASMAASVAMHTAALPKGGAA